MQTQYLGVHEVETMGQNATLSYNLQLMLRAEALKPIKVLDAHTELQTNSTKVNVLSYMCCVPVFHDQVDSVTQVCNCCALHLWHRCAKR